MVKRSGTPPPCRRACCGSASRRSGSARSRSNSVLNVWRLATRNTQNALIIMWTSIGSTSRRKTRLGVAALEDPLDQLDDRVLEAGELLGLAHVLGVVDVLDADEPDELRVRVVVVERQLGQAPDRGARIEVVDVDLRSARGCARRSARAPRCRAAPCRRSSSRSSAWSCACARRSRPRARPRSPDRRTRAWPPRGSRCACARRRAAARAPRTAVRAWHSLSGGRVDWILGSQVSEPTRVVITNQYVHEI